MSEFTERQEEIAKAVAETGSHRKAADKLGVHHSTVDHAMRKMARKGRAPGHFNSGTAPGFTMGKVTIQRNDLGEVERTWERQHPDLSQEHIEAFIESFASSLPRARKVAPPKETADDLMVVLPMGDPHFGMYAWAQECGDDFDLKIAREDLCNAVKYLVDQTPPAARCVIVNLGDFYHADNMAGITTRSGHVLYMDTRLPKMYEVGVLALRQCIETALRRHKTVEIINAVGNHDEVLSFTLSTLLKNVYENEDRVYVHSEPTLRHYVRHGKIFFGVTHGHRTKDSDLPGIMATERAKDWGETKFRYFFRGHHHHDSVKEYNGCIVEQFRTLAAGDSYAVGGGYLSGRDMKALVMHKDFGILQRFVCGIDYLRALRA